MRTLLIKSILIRADDIYCHAKAVKGLPNSGSGIQSDQVKAIAEALVEAINEANSEDENG